jgi:hypothetical protein
MGMCFFCAFVGGNCTYYTLRICLYRPCIPLLTMAAAPVASRPPPRNLQVHVSYDDSWARRDIMGVHPQSQPGLFWVGACVPAGRLVADDFFALADVAEK